MNFPLCDFPQFPVTTWPKYLLSTLRKIELSHHAGENKLINTPVPVGCDSSVVIATCYGLDGPEIESRWGNIFRALPDRPWGPTQPLLYKRYRVFLPRVRRSERGIDHPRPPSAEVKERVTRYLSSNSGASWPVTG